MTLRSMKAPSSQVDAARLSRALLRMLRHGLNESGLVAEPDGWFAVEPVAAAVSIALKVEVVVADLESSRRFGGVRWEIEAGRIRIFSEGREERPRVSDGPDILYHVVARDRIAEIRRSGQLCGSQGRPLSMARQEDQAWRIGHRRWDDPVVLYIDAARARRDGLRFSRSRSGQYQVPGVPLRHVLNLRENFGEQASAGGFLVDWSQGEPRVALVRVSRRSGVTWEVAKGKIEHGELPERAAIREVREEMGINVGLTVRGSLGTIRYGFSTPDGQPRLKTIYLYLLEADDVITSFTPAKGEGIEAVRWFPLEEAIRLLTHPSLRGSIGRLLSVLEERAVELDLSREAASPSESPLPD